METFSHSRMQSSSLESPRSPAGRFGLTGKSSGWNTFLERKKSMDRLRRKRTHSCSDAYFHSVLDKIPEKCVSFHSKSHGKSVVSKVDYAKVKKENVILRSKVKDLERRYSSMCEEFERMDLELMESKKKCEVGMVMRGVLKEKNSYLQNRLQEALSAKKAGMENEVIRQRLDSIRGLFFRDRLMGKQKPRLRRQRAKSCNFGHTHLHNVHALLRGKVEAGRRHSTPPRLSSTRSQKSSPKKKKMKKKASFDPSTLRIKPRKYCSEGDLDKLVSIGKAVTLIRESENLCEYLSTLLTQNKQSLLVYEKEVQRLRSEKNGLMEAHASAMSELREVEMKTRPLRTLCRRRKRKKFGVSISSMNDAGGGFEPLYVILSRSVMLVFKDEKGLELVETIPVFESVINFESNGNVTLKLKTERVEWTLCKPDRCEDVQFWPKKLRNLFVLYTKEMA